MNNPYATIPIVVRSVKRETPRVKTFALQRQDQKRFRFIPGQILAASLPGFGESVFAPSELFDQANTFEISVQKIGRVTTGLHGLKTGDVIGVRGPYGRGFDIDRIAKQDLLLIAGGIGIIPLRSLLRHLTGNFCQIHQKKIQLFYGARSYDDLLFRREFPAWKMCLDLEVTLSKPYPDTNRGWRSHAGLLSTVFKKVAPVTDGLAILCGPPVMFQVMIPKLLALGFDPKNVYLTLERRMQCVGQATCQHCGFGQFYVCKDGPVFRLADVQNTPQFEAFVCA